MGIKDKNKIPLILVTLTIIFFFLEKTDNKTLITPSSTPSINSENKPVYEKKKFKVIRVIDGDTIEIEGRQRVRYIGINAPEFNDSNNCFAKESFLKNKELVEGKEILLEIDVSERDKFGRLLRYVYIDSIFINELLVKEGYANVSTYPPNVKYQQLFLSAEKEARQNKKGLWLNCNE